MAKIPQAFIIKRIHSFMGLWIVFFLIEHLITNSQAALFYGDNGNGFVRMVNSIKALPYLPFIENTLIGVPILVHMLLGINILRTGKSNSMKTDGRLPSMEFLPRNHAYTWQRITSWILVIGIIGHVVQMRFIDYPKESTIKEAHQYTVRIGLDRGIYFLSERLGFTIYNKSEIDDLITKFDEEQKSFKPIEIPEEQEKFDKELAKKIEAQDVLVEKSDFIHNLQNLPLNKGEVIAVADSFGVASLLAVRETFKNPYLAVIYTLFVMASTYHAFNGMWTAMISWGLTLTSRSQKLMRSFTNFLMAVTTFLGLAAIWGSYYLSFIE